MMRATRPTLTVVGLLAALLLVACPEDETATPDTGGDAGDLDDGGADADVGDTGSDATGEVGTDTGGRERLTCYFEDRYRIGCFPCSQTACVDELVSAYGVADSPETPGGACQNFLSCVENCACDDAQCMSFCERNQDLLCRSALADLETCMAGSCLSVCSVIGACGNNQKDVGEDCDGTDLPEGGCEALGYSGGTLGCDDQCFFDESACTGTPDRCDNGRVDVGEDCEGEDLGGMSCASLGYFGGGALACSNDCTFDESGCSGARSTGLDAWFESTAGPIGCDQCAMNDCKADFDAAYRDGDGSARPGSPGGACTDLLGCLDDCDYWDDACQRACEADTVTAGCADAVAELEACLDTTCAEACGEDLAPVCGDGYTEGDEACETLVPLAYGCGDLGFVDGVLSCGGGCAYNQDGCAGGVLGECGDGVVQAALGEECDGDEERLPWCRTLGWDLGAVGCTEDCRLDFSGCSTRLDIPEGTCEVPIDLAAAVTGEGDGLWRVRRDTAQGGSRIGSPTCGGAPGREVVFAWIPELNGTAEVTVVADTAFGRPVFDPVLHVRSACNDDETELVCNDDFLEGPDATVRFEVERFRLYYIVVDSLTIDRSGGFELTVDYDVDVD
jgi:hypothetical protein